MIQKIRLYSGLVLTCFILIHFVNHIFGLVSLTMAEGAKEYLTEFWEDSPLLWLLWSAFLAHITTALWTLFHRRTFRLPWRDILQFLLGLAIIFLLAGHMVATLYLAPFTELELSYELLSMITRVLAPLEGIKLLIALPVVWGHALIGLYLWLGHTPWYVKWETFLKIMAIMIPVWSMAGFLSLGSQAQIWVLMEERVEKLLSQSKFTKETGVFIMETGQTIVMGFTLFLVVFVLLRLFNDLILKPHGRPKLHYGENRVISIPEGASILETVQAAGVTHASICGGQGRCSVCRVMIKVGGEHLPPPSLEEGKVLARVAAPPGVRLACQTRPNHDLAVIPLLPPTVTSLDGYAITGAAHGREMEIAVLFADLRGFTSFSEKKLPYDIVYILNRYFQKMGESVEKSGGLLDKFIGDGVMALFGIESGTENGCREALRCARMMVQGLDDLNTHLQGELGQPLRIGIGIHVGLAIVGEMGYGKARHMTALGDMVNTASRLEGLTKELGVPLVISEPVARWAGILKENFPATKIAIRGRLDPLYVHAIEDISSPDLKV